MYCLFTYFTKLFYFIMHFNFDKDNSLIFLRKNVLSHPFFRDPPLPYSYTTPFYENFFIPPPPYCDFWEALSCPLKEGGDDTMGLHPQMSFSLKSAFLIKTRIFMTVVFVIK